MRAVDHLLGAPLLWTMGRLRRRSAAPPDNPSSVVLLQTVAIGDTLLMAQSVAMLRRRFPGARLRMVAGPSNREAAGFLPGLDDIVEIHPMDVAGSVRSLRRLAPDILVDYGPWPRVNALFAALSSAKFTVGFRTPGQHRHYCQDLSVLHCNDVHEQDNQIALATALGSVPQPRAHLVVPPASARLPELPARYVVIHPWPGGTAAHLKRWSLAGWLGVAQCARAHGMATVITGGPGDVAAAVELRAQLLAEDGELDVRCVAGGCSLSDTAHLLLGAACVVSVDTGIMHLAGLLDCPTIALHGPTRPDRWGARGARVVAVQAPGNDCGYLELGFDIPKRPPPPACMDRITPAMVVAEMARLPCCSNP